MNFFNKKQKYCLIIGEVAQAHEGSLAMAHAFIDAIADAGADAVKFQTHIAAAESTPDEPWRVRFSTQDKTRYDYWKRMEFSLEQWRELKRHAEKRGLLFLSSPFSIEAVELLLKTGIKAWKIASGEITNTPLLERIMMTRLPILLSTGISPVSEIDRVVKKILGKKISLTLMQCSSIYPCPPEKTGLGMIPFFKKRYNCKVGLSDHTGKIYAGLAAATLGMDALEVHVTFNRKMFSPDAVVSLTLEELKQLVEGVRFIEKMRASKSDKNTIARETSGIRKIFTKSIVAAVPLKAGMRLRKKHLAFKKPGTGIPASQFERILGAKLLRDVSADYFFKKKDLQWPK